MNALLPPLPAAIRTLSDMESRHLDSRYPDLPRSLNHCVTCRGARTFRWYGPGSRVNLDRMPEVLTYDCNCAEQWVLNRYLLHCGIGLAYQRLDWDDCAIKVPSEMVEWMANSEPYIAAGLGFVLTGPMGNGKSMLAQLGLKTMLAQGIDGYFTTFTEMIDNHTASWRDKADRKWFTRRIRNAGVLVIDDLGRETKQKRTRTRAEVGSGVEQAEIVSSHPFMVTAFEEIIRHRVSSAKPTIITTNDNFNDLAKHYSTNVFSLLHERSDVIAFSGADYRDEARQRFKAEVRLGLTRPVVLA